jgi:hypothetical protein
VILATQEAEIRRIMVGSQPGQIVQVTLSQKTLHKNRAGGVAQGKGPEFKPQYHKKKKKVKSSIAQSHSKSSMVPHDLWALTGQCQFRPCESSKNVLLESTVTGTKNRKSNGRPENA